MFRSIAIVELATLWVLCPALNADQASLLAEIRNGNLAGVKQQLASGTDLNGFDAAGSSPLMAAVLRGRAEIVSYLVAQGADVNARQTDTASTPLRYAVLAGRADLVEILLGAKARIDLRYSDQQTILHIASARANTTIVELLLSAGAEVNLEDAASNTPLDEAVTHDRKENVNALIAHGANVQHVRALDGRGPFHQACIKGYADLLPVLIQAGADPSAPDRSDQTPLDLALDYSNKTVISALLKRSEHYEMLRSNFAEAMERANRNGRTEIVRILLDAGWDVNHSTASGSTYLNDAALKGNMKLVRLLLERHANLDVRNEAGGTPLHDAALSGNTDVIALLLDRGCPIDARESESGATPLMMAASLGRTAAVALLLERGANPLLKDNAGRTALARAYENQNQALVKLLEAARLKPSARAQIS
jgi:ankyrin repeat protein